MSIKTFFASSMLLNFILSSYAAFLLAPLRIARSGWLLFQKYSPRTPAMALRVASLRSWPYRICDVHVRDLLISRASLETSSPLSQSRILALRSNVLFFVSIFFKPNLNRCYFWSSPLYSEKEYSVKQKMNNG